MLWKLTTTNKYGNLRSRIVHSNGPLTIGQGFGPFVGASLFRYQSKKSYFGIFKSPVDGKHYLTPDWTEVIEGTTINDVIHIPEVKVEIPKETDEWLFESSSSPGQFYKVRKIGATYKCNCPGVWRSKDRECKHIKSVKNV
jgi:hypothetical protein